MRVAAEIIRDRRSGDGSYSIIVSKYLTEGKQEEDGH